jgi:hypothetical protein
MTTTAKIGAALASPTFGTTGTAKMTWTPTATTYTGGASGAGAVAFVTKVSVFLWGSAADKTADEPYKTMNTWYTTNKAAIDAASLASSTQVASWALYMDISLNVKSNELWPLGATSAAPSASTTTVTAVTATTIPNGTVHAAVGHWGDSFTIGLHNETTKSQTPALRWGTRTTDAGVAGSTDGVATNDNWMSFAWTVPTAIKSWTSITAE